MWPNMLSRINLYRSDRDILLYQPLNFRNQCHTIYQNAIHCKLFAIWKILDLPICLISHDDVIQVNKGMSARCILLYR